MMMMQQEIEKMYGDGLKYYMAQTPDKFYMVMGPDSEQALKTLIDQPASAAASGDIKIAMDTLQNTPYNDFVCSINVIKLVKAGHGTSRTDVQWTEGCSDAELSRCRRQYCRWTGRGAIGDSKTTPDRDCNRRNATATAGDGHHATANARGTN
jgi:hypothetical protein